MNNLCYLPKVPKSVPPYSVMFWHHAIVIALCASAFSLVAAAPDAASDAIARIPLCGVNFPSKEYVDVAD